MRKLRNYQGKDADQNNDSRNFESSRDFWKFAPSLKQIDKIIIKRIQYGKRKQKGKEMTDSDYPKTSHTDVAIIYVFKSVTDEKKQRA